MDTVKLGIVGIGTMGTIHAQSVMDGNIPRCKLTAVCDPKVERLIFSRRPKVFFLWRIFCAPPETDAVLIATPHYSHTDIGIRALESGRHVLVEKPISVHKSDAERLVAAHRSSESGLCRDVQSAHGPFLSEAPSVGAVRRSRSDQARQLDDY